MNTLHKLCEHCASQWKNTQCHTITIDKISTQQQLENEHKIWTLLKQAESFQKCPAKLKDYLQQDTIWNFSQLSEAFQKQFCEITKLFILDAKAFDASLSDESIIQALRNVWIILMLELMMRQRLIYHPAIFSYSMLYPYTDNYLDDVTICKEDKKAFNERLRNRLQGIPYDTYKGNEAHINRLINNIEQTYDRKKYPQVYESLLHIQKGQEDSLKQHNKLEDALYISIQKGGSSVLADGYLIDGTLHEEEQQFCMEYGFALQLADDLQDIDEDKEHQHVTLFTKCDMEQLAKKLLHYIQNMMKHQSVCAQKEFCAVIEKGCIFLVLGAIIAHREQFTTTFMKDVFSCFPITKVGLQKLISSHKISTHEVLDMFLTNSYF